MKVRYTVVLDPDPDEGGYAVFVPALPGCFSQGDTVEEALANAQEAIKVHVRSMARHGEPIPAEGAGLLVAHVEAEIVVGELAPV